MGIVFFAPDRDNGRTFRRVLGTHAEDVRIIEALLSESIPIARRLRRKEPRCSSHAAGRPLC